MSTMSETPNGGADRLGRATAPSLDIERQLDWAPTWYGYEHRHSDYQVVVFDQGEAVLEAKGWPHPILPETTLVGALSWVSEHEGITWSRYEDTLTADDDLSPMVGMILAGLAAIGAGAVVWALIGLAAWLVLR